MTPGMQLPRSGHDLQVAPASRRASWGFSAGHFSVPGPKSPPLLLTAAPDMVYDLQVAPQGNRVVPS
jgi:hypothetical protein